MEYMRKVSAEEKATEEEISNWRQPFIDDLQTSKLPQDKSLAHQIKKRALSYARIEGVLDRRSFGLRCLDKSEAQKRVKEVHSGLCGAHQSGPKMKIQIKRKDWDTTGQQ